MYHALGEGVSPLRLKTVATAVFTRPEIDTRGATAYITDPPCPGCRKALAAAGIIRAVWPGGEYDRAGLLTW